MNVVSPLPLNEMSRALKLSEFDLDYSDVQESLQDLTRLAAKIAGTSISLINLIDVFTQWTISNYGLSLEQMSREDSVCQYTILAKESLEVKDLTADDRFKDKFYVTGEPNVTYYFGVPLQTNDGFNIGSLCVLDKIGKEITPEKVEQLKIVASEIVNRLAAFQMVHRLKKSVGEAMENQRKVAHDIRGPLSGIISLAKIINEQDNNSKIGDILPFVTMIQKSGSALLELANEILTGHTQPETKAGKRNGQEEFNLLILKDKLEKLFKPQALPKNIDFSVHIKDENETVPISKNKLMQIAGNLLSNAIKFTPDNGTVTVELSLVVAGETKKLSIRVKDSGIGMDDESIDCILHANAVSTDGTDGEKGFGFGLSLVKRLVDGLGGTLSIQSKPGKGTNFEVQLHQE
jgi:signal transduction histidine kinase